MLRLIFCLLTLPLSGVGWGQVSDTTIVILTPAEQEAVRRKQNFVTARLPEGDTAALTAAIALLRDERITRDVFGNALPEVPVWGLTRLHAGNCIDFSNISDWWNVSGPKLSVYLAENRSRLIYSPLLRRFTDVPLAERTIDFRIRDRNWADEDEAADFSALRSETDKALAKGQRREVIQLLPRIGQAGTPEAFAYLRKLAEQKPWPENLETFDGSVERALQFALSNFDSAEAMGLILDLFREEPEGWQRDYSYAEFLPRITGVKIGNRQSEREADIAAYRELLASRGSLAAVREFGYEEVSGLSGKDFTDRTEFLVKVVRASGKNWWVSYNALRELMETHDPVVLRELAWARCHYAGYLLGGVYYDAEKWLLERTNTRIEARNDAGSFVSSFRNEDSDRDLLIYWSRHYRDYRWSKKADRFLYKGRNLLPADEVEQLYAAVEGHNEALAFTAIHRLTAQEPETLRLAIDRFLIRKPKKNLFPQAGQRPEPPLSERLAALAELRVYGDSRNLPGRASLDVIAWSTAFGAAESDEERRLVATELKRVLSLESLNVLEPYLLIRGKSNLPLYAMSLSIIGAWYEEHWPEIIADPDALGLCLKKLLLYPKADVKRRWSGLRRQFNRPSAATIAALRVVVANDKNGEVVAAARRIILKE